MSRAPRRNSVLCGIRDSDNKKVFAYQSVKANGPFSCPKCRCELILKKGKIKVHHFAHKPPFNCGLGKGETDTHRRCKESIYRCLANRDNVSHLDVEANLGPIIADVYAEINGKPVAIEVQKSKVSVNEIRRRTIEYEKLGINVLWLALLNKKLNQDRYSPSAWEKWCHAAYFGRVYYWLVDLTVIPFHFSECQLYVEESTWYESGGYERSEGGYYRTSKRYKTPVAGNHVDIATHFVPNLKRAWSGGSIDIPKCRIYLDNQKPWWKKA